MKIDLRKILATRHRGTHLAKDCQASRCLSRVFHRRRFEFDLNTHWQVEEPPIADEGKLWDIVDALVEIGEEKGISAARVALAWLLGRPGVTSLIVGGRTEAQFKDNLAAAEVKLTTEERGRSTRSASRRCSTPIGIRRKPRATASARRIWRCSRRI